MPEYCFIINSSLTCRSQKLFLAVLFSRPLNFKIFLATYFSTPETSSVYVSSSGFHVGQRRDLTLSSHVIPPVTPHPPPLYNIKLKIVLYGVCLCWKRYWAPRVSPQQGSPCPLCHSCQSNETAVDSEARESFILSSNNGTLALQHTLSQKALGNGQQQGCFVGFLSAGRGRSSSRLGTAMLLKGAAAWTARLSVSARSTLPPPSWIEVSCAELLHTARRAEVPGAASLHTARCCRHLESQSHRQRLSWGAGAVVSR